MGTSAGQILFGCDLISLAGYLKKGIFVNNNRLAFEDIKRVGPGGNFLEDEHTIELLRS